MKRSRILSLLTLLAAPALLAQTPTPKPAPPPTPRPAPVAAVAAPQGVDIASRLTGTLADGGRVALTLVGSAIHTLSGRRVLFTAKQLVARDPGILGPVTVTLDPRFASTGTLSSPTLPATHKQNFYLRIQSEKLGALIADAPLTLSARIESTPPTATYKSTSGDVPFYKEGDPGKRPVLTVHQVTSEVRPAVATVVDITSRVTARVGGAVANLVLVGSAAHLLNGTSVLFIAKRLVARDPGAAVGPLTISLDPKRPSVGTLSSETLPGEHRQSFFLRIQSGRLGNLVSDDPVIMTAKIESTPPTATYKMAGGPVAFHRQGDPKLKPVLSIEGVESDVTPAAPQGVEISSRLTGTLAGTGNVTLTLVGAAAHTQVGQLVFFNAKQLIARDPGNLGPITATLDPLRASIGTLSSPTFPAIHRQSFFLRIENEKLGTLVSAAPLILSARIESSPPTATYRSSGGKVAFYREGDPDRKAVLTVQQVTSNVRPAAQTSVNVNSRVTARVAGATVNLRLVGLATHLLGGTSVIFIAKRLVAQDPGDLGPLTATLDPRRPSFGSLSSPTFPARHRQSFFLQLHNERLGTLVSDAPLTLSAEIESSPPKATYKLDGQPVDFYREGDRGKRSMLTITGVESDVTPAVVVH